VDESFWRVEEGRLPGSPTGSVVCLVQQGTSALVLRDGVGQVGTLDASTTAQTRMSNGSSLTLVNKTEGWHAVLSRQAGYDAANTSAVPAAPRQVAIDVFRKRLGEVAEALEKDAIRATLERVVPHVEAEVLGLTDMDLFFTVVTEIQGLQTDQEWPDYLADIPLLGVDASAIVHELLDAGHLLDDVDVQQVPALCEALRTHYEGLVRLAAGRVLFNIAAGTYPESGPSEQAYQFLAGHDLLPAMGWEARAARLGL
jgi:hypothetical protein